METNNLPPTTNNNGNSNKTTRNILIGLGVAVVFCLCAVAVGIFALRAVGQKVKESIVTDPDQVSNVADRIAKYEIPSGYSEQMAMDFGLYQLVMLAPSGYSSNQPMIMLMSYSSAMGADTQQMQEQMQRSFEQQSGQPGLTWSTVDEHTVTIRGQQVNVVVREGRTDSGFIMRQLVTAFDGENGTVLVMIQGEADAWDQKMIDEFLSSIQ